MVLEAIKYHNGSLQVLDQLQLPHKVHYDEVQTSKDGWQAIKDMRVRGAPAIAMVGILSLAVEIQNRLQPLQGDVEVAIQTIDERLDYIVTSRPTAVNLKNMADDFKKIIREAPKGIVQPDSDTVFNAYVMSATKTLEVDLRDNRLLGDHGARWIIDNARTNDSAGLNILTHCNTGSLATAGYGTALGVIRSVHAMDKLQQAYCTETRPYNQGSRLTAFELVHDQIPATLVTDSMAAALMHIRSQEGNPIAAVVVGADRIVANGDTANKIGTYALAIAAKQHGVRFLVAAPCSTVDLKTASGQHINIEQRAASEMTSIAGPVIQNNKLDLDKPAQRVSIAASGINVWNPAFDVTPASLIDAIVTEKGVITKSQSSDIFDMADVVNKATA
ncbi:MAG: hypothetical protein Q9162_005566 [Coniocarpon cinnabarinum]